MIIPPAIQRKHDFIRPYLEDVAGRVRDIVTTYCDVQGYAYLGRTKASESLAEKIETGRFARWSDLDDLFACCVIVPTPADEPGVLEYLSQVFELVDCRRRGTTQKDPTVFRFDATRFIGKLRAAALPDASPDVLAVKFEIQVRSAFEHAWSVATHTFSYKGGEVDWRRLRLAAQLKAAVEQLDQVVLGFETTASAISEQTWPEIKAKQFIERHIRSEIQKGRLPSETAPSSWARFCENLYRAIISSTDKVVQNPPKLVQEALAKIGAEIEETSPEAFPRSVSLLQFCVGALAKRGFFEAPLRKYTPLITSELLDLFPDSRRLGSGFDLELIEADSNPT